MGALFGLGKARDNSYVSYDSSVPMNSEPMASVTREYVCKFCDTASTFTFNGSEALVCPVCGAPVSPSDAANMSASAAPAYDIYDTSTRSSVGTRRRSSSVIIKMILLPVVVIAVYYAIRPAPDGGGSGSTSRSLNGDSVYVPALSRTVYWSSEYNSFYDQPTDCYFFYNGNIDPADWQYWYEGISSDYGDYGWMEWDNIESQWYINTSGSDWIVLPAKYESSRLWHF